MLLLHTSLAVPGTRADALDNVVSGGAAEFGQPGRGAADKRSNPFFEQCVPIRQSVMFALRQVALLNLVNLGGVADQALTKLHTRVCAVDNH